MSEVTYQQAVEQIKNQLDIVDVISRYVVLKKTGRNFQGLCPFHNEKTPSFVVTPDKQIFKCFGCGEGGDVLTFLMKINNQTFAEVIEEQAANLGIELPKFGNKNNLLYKAEKDRLYDAMEQAQKYFSKNLESNQKALEYLEKRGIPVPMKKDDTYSRDKNLWHLSHEGLELEDPANEPNYDKLLHLSVTPEKAPDTPEYVVIDFEEGIPVKVNGETMSPASIVKKLNEIGGKNAIGTIDLVENRVVGMKSRGVYETPGGTILYAAHKELEYLCLDKQTQSFKQIVANKFAELTYSGEWFTPLREALSAFVDETQKTVTGTVKLKLYKGNIIPAGAKSPYSLYNESLASFTTGDLYSHKDAEGFINLFGLPLKVNALMKKKNELNKEQKDAATLGV